MFVASNVTLAHHPYWWSFHTLACPTCERLKGDGLPASIPLTALSSRSFCRGAKVDIVVVFTSVTEEDYPLGNGHAKPLGSKCDREDIFTILQGKGESIY